MIFRTLTLMVLALASVAARALSGDVDGTFFSCRGCTGVVTNFGGLDEFHAVAQQADGRIVAVGVTTGAVGVQRWIVARFSASGSLDGTFDGDGRVVLDAGGGGARAVAIQADGRIVVAGRGPAGFAAFRLNANGSRDTGFARDGFFSASFGSGANAVAIDSVGNIVLGGAARNPSNSSKTDMALLVLTSTGAPDTTFGPNADGRVNRSLDGLDDAINALAIRSDGTIFAAGRGQGRLALASFSRAIGAGGRVFASHCSSTGTSIAVQPDGKFLVAGSFDIACNATPRLPFVMRFSDLSPDSTFGGSAGIALSFGGASSGATAVRAQPDGRIVVAGTVQVTSDGRRAQFGLVRLESSGAIDRTFSGDGAQQVDFGTGIARPFAMLLQARDARIVVAGSLQTFDSAGATQDLNPALVRLHAFTCNNRNATRVGTSGNDVLSSGATGDVLHGANGNDVIHGNGADDTICGGAGDDQLFGDEGNDTLFGQDGQDSLNGGDGTGDTCVPGLKGVALCDLDTFQSCETISNCLSGLSGEWLRLEQHCARSPQERTQQCVLTGTLSVFNPGQESTPVPAAVSFFLSEDAVLDADDTLLTVEKVRAIGAGESQVLPFVHRLPGATDLLGRYVIAFVDATDVIPERNEDNNHAAGLISGRP
jgi:uncharacterized delta-60 repeat protein